MPAEEPDSQTLQAAARIGTVLRGKYRIDRVLGIGGMAVVYKATHRNQAEFAVKMLHPELSMREEIRARFLREGYAANSVKHPGAVAVVDDDIAEDGAAFIVMELLDGAPVETLWQRGGERLPLRAVLSVAHQLLDVLAAAHEKGIVHRDIKPENLFATRDGTLKVLDFGIARLMDSAGAPGSGKGTGTGMLLGTPAFMAPEQAYAKASEIDGQTDLWSVGATLFTLLTGQPVHLGDNAAQLMVQAATTRARSIATLDATTPPNVAHVIDRALAFEKAARWGSAAEMREAILQASVQTLGEPPSKAALAVLLPPDERGPTASAQSAGSAPSPGTWGTPGPNAPGSIPRAIVRSGPGAPAVGTAQTVASQATGTTTRTGWAVVGVAAVTVAALAIVAAIRFRPTLPVHTPPDAGIVTDASLAGDAATHPCTTGNKEDCTAQCEKNDAPSCAVLGWMYRQGKGGVAKDDDRAFAAFKAACDAKNASGCNGLGSAYESGLGAPRDETRAAELFAGVCSAAEPSACNGLAKLYVRGKGVNKDDAKALALFQQACDAGFGPACANAGHAYAKGKIVTKDDAKAIALMKQGCDLDGLLGCSFLGEMYAKGQGVKKDDAHALALYKQGCDDGNPLGCALLGEFYVSGRGGLKKDDASAFELFNKACAERATGQGCTDLGELYADGRGVAKDEAKAVDLFEQSCNADSEAGCFALGLKFEKGVGVPADRGKALALYRRGCKAFDEEWCCSRWQRVRASR